MKLIFLVAARAVSVLGLSRREAWWKEAGILMLRHQLTVALRQQPRAHARLTWTDRAWLALVAETLPIERVAGMRLIVTPGTSMRWHRDIVRLRWRVCRARAGPAARRRTARSGRRCCGWPGRMSLADPQERRDRSGASQGRPGLG